MKRELDFVPVSTLDVEERMIVLRQQPVLLDCDVAALYGVKTKEINQAVRNNPNKFPTGYVFLLCDEEKGEVVKIFDRLNKLKFSTVAPTAFTERGLYMLATILKSERAVNTTLAIIDTFVRTRELARTMAQLQNVQDGGEQQRSLLHRTGVVLSDIVGRNLSTNSTETEIELKYVMIIPKFTTKPAGFKINFRYRIGHLSVLEVDFSFYSCTFSLHG